MRLRCPTTLSIAMVAAGSAAISIQVAAPAHGAALQDAPSKSAPATTEEPRDIVAAIYKAAVVSLRKRGESPIEDPAIRARYFTKKFDVALTAADTKAAHDKTTVFAFDPISASRDAELQKATIKTDVLEPGKAVVSASFLNHGQQTVVSYDFIKEDGAWKVDDIKGTTEKEAWSVTKILRNPAREPTKLPGMKDATKAPDADIKATPPKRPDDKALKAR